MTNDSYLRAMETGSLRLDRNSPTYTLDLLLHRLDPDLVRNVSALCEQAEADIVFSTSWRGTTDEEQRTLESALKARGLSPEVAVVGQTPRLYGQSRGEEIVAWLDRHRPGWTCDQIVVLDDHDISCVPDRWVPSTWKQGFTETHLQQALRAFGLLT